MRVAIENLNYRVNSRVAEYMVLRGQARWLRPGRLQLCLPSETIARWSSYSRLQIARELRFMPHIGRFRMNGSLINRAL